MPYESHHFIPKERSGEIPPWGTERGSTGGGKVDHLTTNQWMFRGLEGLPAKPIRNNTTNHFDPQNWRSRSGYKETFFTPQMYSRHEIYNASPFRNHKPHARVLWPLEPNKSYMIWNPKPIDPELLKRYSAPSLLRQCKQNNWQTTTQTAYQDYFFRKPLPRTNEEGSHPNQSRSDERENMESALNSKDNMRPATEDPRSTPAHLRTLYRGQYKGDPGRPSTNARPLDYSWRNIKY